MLPAVFDAKITVKLDAIKQITSNFMLQIDAKKYT